MQCCFGYKYVHIVGIIVCLLVFYITLYLIKYNKNNVLKKYRLWIALWRIVQVEVVNVGSRF